MDSRRVESGMNASMLEGPASGCGDSVRGWAAGIRGRPGREEDRVVVSAADAERLGTRTEDGRSRVAVILTPAWSVFYVFQCLLQRRLRSAVKRDSVSFRRSLLAGREEVCRTIRAGGIKHDSYGLR